MIKTPWSRSGNGATSAQDLYTMVNVPFVWAWKIGISADSSRRAVQNSRRVPGRYFVVARVRIVYAYAIEQRILKATKWAKTSIFGMGGKEVRLFLVGLPVMLFIWIIHLIKYLLWAAVIIGLSWYAYNYPA